MEDWVVSTMRLTIFFTAILSLCCPMVSEKPATTTISATTSSCIISVELLYDVAWCTGPSTIFFAPSASLISCCFPFPDDILLLPSSSFSYIIVVAPGLYSIEHLRKLASGSTGTKMETLTPAGHCITFTTDDSVNTAKVIFIQGMEIIQLQPNLFYNGMVVVHGLQAFRISTTLLSLPPPFHPDHRSGTPGAMVPPAIMRLMSRDVILEDLAMKLLILSARAPTFDYYKRADQWAKGVCVTSPGKCIPPILPTHFTLHGLWPSNNVGKQPKCCSPSSHLDPKLIDDLMPRLKYGWPSLFKPDDKFWEHQWHKHGTCSSLQEHDYFKLVLDVYEKYNLTSILEDEGIIPRPTSYPKADITKAIKSKIGFEPELVCNGKYLVEIRLCLDVTATVYQQCPPQHGRHMCQSKDILFVA